MEINFDTPLTITRPTITRCGGCDRRFGTDDPEDMADTAKRYWVGGDFSQTKNQQLFTQNGRHWCEDCLAKIYICELCGDPGVDDARALFTLNGSMVMGIDETRKMCPTCADAIGGAVVRCTNEQCLKSYINTLFLAAETPTGERVRRWFNGYHFTQDEISSTHILTDNIEGLIETTAGRCDACTTVAACYFCHAVSIEATTLDVERQGLVGFEPETTKITLCKICFMGHITCACKRVVAVDFTTRLSTGEIYCNDCVNVGPDGKMIYDPEGRYANAVVDITAFDRTAIVEQIVPVDRGFDEFMAQRPQQRRINRYYDTRDDDEQDDEEPEWDDDDTVNQTNTRLVPEPQHPVFDRQPATTVAAQFDNLTGGFEADPFAETNP